jgi:hypothetical protein
MMVKVLRAGEGRKRSTVGLEGIIMGGGGNWERHSDPSEIPVA